MKLLQRFIVPTCLWLLATPAGLAAPSGSALAEINYLLDFVASSGCVFIRNGSSHEPGDASSHLRLKLDRGGRYVSTAEQFIDRLASESSWTGKPYTTDCQGTVTETGPWLHEALLSYRKKAQ